VTDRPGHDRRYAIDPTRTSNELGWQPRHRGRTHAKQELGFKVKLILELRSWLLA